MVEQVFRFAAKEVAQSLINTLGVQGKLSYDSKFSADIEVIGSKDGFLIELSVREKEKA